MNRLLICLAVLIFSSSCVDKVKKVEIPSLEEVKIITAEDLFTKYIKDTNYLIVDNRPSHLYEMGHIKRAVSMTYKNEGSFENILTKEKLLSIVKNKKVILYCNGFMRAENAIKDAIMKWQVPAGRLLWFKGGMTEWLRGGYPVVK